MSVISTLLTRAVADAEREISILERDAAAGLAQLDTTSATVSSVIGQLSPERLRERFAQSSGPILAQAAQVARIADDQHRQAMAALAQIDPIANAGREMDKVGHESRILCFNAAIGAQTIGQGGALSVMAMELSRLTQNVSELARVVSTEGDALQQSLAAMQFVSEELQTSVQELEIGLRAVVGSARDQVAQIESLFTEALHDGAPPVVRHQVLGEPARAALRELLRVG